VLTAEPKVCTSRPVVWGETSAWMILNVKRGGSEEVFDFEVIVGASSEEEEGI